MEPDFAPNVSVSYSHYLPKVGLQHPAAQVQMWLWALHSSAAVTVNPTEKITVAGISLFPKTGIAVAVGQAHSNGKAISEAWQDLGVVQVCQGSISRLPGSL